MKMFDVNRGYIGASRSVRSQRAVCSYEVPLSMINRDLIDEFLDHEQEDLGIEDVKFLKKISIAKWKYVASQRMAASSWHHTGLYFNETDHYSMHSIARKLIELKDTLDTEYKEYRDSKKKDVMNVKYGVIKVEIWGGSRNHSRLEGYQEVAGIVIGDWLFYKNYHSVNDGISKFKTSANKVEWFKTYDSYADLVKNHEKYKGSKKVFNKLIKEKGEK